MLGNLSQRLLGIGCRTRDLPISPLILNASAELNIDGFQMSIKRPTSGGQTYNQEAAVQQTFYLRTSFFYLSALTVRTRCSTSLPIFRTQLHQTHTPTLALQK